MIESVKGWASSLYHPHPHPHPHTHPHLVPEEETGAHVMGVQEERGAHQFKSVTHSFPFQETGIILFKL